MRNVYEYKGYHTKIEFDTETLTLRGKIEGIADLVDFECADPSKIEMEFHNAVDDYLDFCAEVGKTPEKEYKGTFNVRIAPYLHRSLAMLSNKQGISLNQAVEKAVEAYITEDMRQIRDDYPAVQIIVRNPETGGIYPGVQPFFEERSVYDPSAKVQEILFVEGGDN